MPGDRIGVTAPSSGVRPELRPRLDHAVSVLRDKGFEVVLGECLGAATHVSAPRRARADELMAMLVDPDIAAVVPPWGGETTIDLLDLLDFDLLAACDPTWFLGFSDTTTTMLPLTTRSGWATVHGWNLMDTPYAAAPGHLHWLDVVGAAAGSTLTQTSATHRRSDGWDDYVAHPTVSEMTLTTPTRWQGLRPQDEEVAFSGRLIGGCLEVLCHLGGTAYGDVPAFVRGSGPDGAVIYLEAAQWDPFDVARALHGLRLAGWFNGVNGVLIGRSPSPDLPGWRQRDAIADALGDLPCPVVLDVDFGHTQPSMTFVNGALAEVSVTATEQRVTQTLA